MKFDQLSRAQAQAIATLEPESHYLLRIHSQAVATVACEGCSLTEESVTNVSGRKARKKLARRLLEAGWIPFPGTLQEFLCPECAEEYVDGPVASSAMDYGVPEEFIGEAVNPGPGAKGVVGPRGSIAIEPAKPLDVGQEIRAQEGTRWTQPEINAEAEKMLDESKRIAQIYAKASTWEGLKGMSEEKLQADNLRLQKVIDQAQVDLSRVEMERDDAIRFRKDDLAGTDVGRLRAELETERTVSADRASDMVRYRAKVADLEAHLADVTKRFSDAHQDCEERHSQQMVDAGLTMGRQSKEIADLREEVEELRNRKVFIDARFSGERIHQGATGLILDGAGSEQELMHHVVGSGADARFACGIEKGRGVVGRGVTGPVPSDVTCDACQQAGEETMPVYFEPSRQRTPAQEAFDSWCSTPAEKQQPRMTDQRRAEWFKFWAKFGAPFPQAANPLKSWVTLWERGVPAARAERAEDTLIREIEEELVEEPIDRGVMSV